MMKKNVESMMTTQKKVKVVFGESRLLIPCGDGADRVERLVDDINRRFQSHLGDPTVRAKELATNDGFLVNPRDRIDHVIDDSAVLVALDYKTWLRANVALLDAAHHTLSRPDFAEGNWQAPQRFAEVGKHKHNKLFIKIGSTGGDADGVDDRLELFDAESLRTFGSGGDDGRVLVAHRAVKDKAWDWSVEVHFIVEKGVVVAVELSVRTTSDPRSQIEVVPIFASDLKLGEAKVTQTAFPPKPNKTYTLPAATVEGPCFSDTDFIPAHLAPSSAAEQAVVPENVAKGDLAIEIKQKDPVQPDQSWASKGVYSNLFYNHLAIFNPLEKEVAIVKVKSEYEKSQGEWVEMNTRLGSKSGNYRYSFNSNLEGFALETNDRRNLAVESSVKITAPQYDCQRRAHPSLPSPLRIRITIEDKEGKSAQIVTEHVNPPLVLTTKESRDKSENRTSHFWVAADDTAGEARVWIEVLHVPESHRLQFAGKPADRTPYLYKNNIDNLLFLAKKDAKTEVEVDELSYKDETIGYAQKVIALVDLENNWVYALRFEIETNTTKVVDHYLLPDLLATA